MLETRLNRTRPATLGFSIYFSKFRRTTSPVIAPLIAGRAPALSGNVRRLLPDESFEGLARAVVQGLFTKPDELRKELPIIIVEHNLDLVLALADRVIAPEKCAVIHKDEAGNLLNNIEYRQEILWL